MSPWETVGAARYAADMMKIVVGLDRYVIAATDAPALIMEGEDCDVWQVPVGDSAPFVVGRAGWSAEGRMMVLSLPGKCGICYLVGGQVVNHYIARDKRPCAVIAPPAPEPMAREPTRDGAAMEAV